ncbi:MAG: dockerin type I domain-containing protein [Planctomycetota bacterium]|jgi:Ca2+-binding EF-hand superfamily protein
MQISSESIQLQPHQAARSVQGHAGRAGHPAHSLAPPPGATSTDLVSFQPPKELDLSQYPITLEGLQRAWGTSAPLYDLNTDGTVNMADLLVFLARQTTPESPESGPLAPSENGPALQPDVSAPAPGNDLPKITEEGFDGAWGTDDPNYDLNGDGTVNMVDLLEFLAQQGQTSNAGPDESEVLTDTPAEVLTDTPGELTEEGFQAAWGTSDANYDLNGDGTVNMADLLTFLDQMNQQQQPGTNGVPDIDSPSLIEQFQQAWGTDNEAFDLNGDGTVNMADLLAYLEQVGGGKGDQAREAGEAGAVRPPHAHGVDPERLSRSIIARFEAAGFSERPPSNARQIVDGLGLDDLTSRLLIDRIASRYPHGLKLDLTG